MYEGLREGLRAATQVTLLNWTDLETDTLVQSIERHGQSWWKQRTARIALVTANFDVMSYLLGAQWEVANRIIDSILEGVNWNEFFPTPENPLDKLFKEGLLTVNEIRELHGFDPI